MQPTQSNRFKRLTKRAWEFSPVIAALAIALVFASGAVEQGKPWLLSVLMGAAAGVITTWFIYFSIYRIYMFVTRGAPFRVGDRIMVTGGPHAGAIGEVQRLCDGRCSVFVALQHEGRKTEPGFFDWNEIRKIHKQRTA